MANLRSVNTYFWADSYVSDLTTSEKLLFLYLITNPLVTLAGCYEVTVKRIVFDTDIERSEVIEMLAKFERDGKIIYRDQWMVLKNFLLHQSLNENMRKNVRTVLADTPDWVKRAIATVMESSESLAKGFETFINGLPTPRKDEVEGEVEKEAESEAADAAARTPEPVFDSSIDLMPETDTGDITQTTLAMAAFGTYEAAFKPARLSIPQREMIAVKVEDLRAWRSTIDFWVGNGYRPKSILKMLEYYDEEVRGEHKKYGNNRNNRKRTDQDVLDESEQFYRDWAEREANDLTN